jgi:hypothetical protein
MFFNQTVEQDGSFVKISSIKATKMAQDTLNWITQKRADRKANAIEEERQRINNGFFHKLFHLREATEQDAIYSLQGDIYNFEYHWSQMAYYKSEEAAQRVLNACKHVDDIFISTEDLQRIS